MYNLARLVILSGLGMALPQKSLMCPCVLHTALIRAHMYQVKKGGPSVIQVCPIYVALLSHVHYVQLNNEE